MRISDWSSDVCSSDLRDEVGQIRMPNPNDPYRGLGPVQSLLSILVGQRAALDYNRNFFINGAGPGGIIEFPEELDDDEWRRFKRRWDSSHQGVANAHKRSEEHTSELQSLMRISYAVFCLKKKKKNIIDA